LRWKSVLAEAVAVPVAVAAAPGAQEQQVGLVLAGEWVLGQRKARPPPQAAKACPRTPDD